MDWPWNFCSIKNKKNSNYFRVFVFLFWPFLLTVGLSVSYSYLKTTKNELKPCNYASVAVHSWRNHIFFNIWNDYLRFRYRCVSLLNFSFLTIKVFVEGLRFHNSVFFLPFPYKWNGSSKYNFVKSIVCEREVEWGCETDTTESNRRYKCELENV